MTDYFTDETKQAAHPGKIWSRVSAEARRYASHYSEASDGRNTFILFAEWADLQAATISEQPKPKVTRTYWLVHFNGKRRSADAFFEKLDAERYAEDCAGNVAAVTGPHEITFTKGEGLKS